jgi:hypothetical protein
MGVSSIAKLTEMIRWTYAIWQWRWWLIGIEVQKGSQGAVLDRFMCFGPMCCNHSSAFCRELGMHTTWPASTALHGRIRSPDLQW